MAAVADYVERVEEGKQLTEYLEALQEAQDLQTFLNAVADAEARQAAAAAAAATADVPSDAVTLEEWANAYYDPNEQCPGNLFPDPLFGSDACIASL